jgi:two-component system chemotaxis response regulator CheB
MTSRKAMDGGALSLARPEVVVIGTSAGGLRALEQILGTLPADFPVPIVAVQHRSRESEAFASVMQSFLALPVHEAAR